MAIKTCERNEHVRSKRHYSTPGAGGGPFNFGSCAGGVAVGAVLKNRCCSAAAAVMRLDGLSCNMCDSRSTVSSVAAGNTSFMLLPATISNAVYVGSEVMAGQSDSVGVPISMQNSIAHDAYAHTCEFITSWRKRDQHESKYAAVLMCVPNTAEPGNLVCRYCSTLRWHATLQLAHLQYQRCHALATSRMYRPLCTCYCSL